MAHFRGRLSIRRRRPVLGWTLCQPLPEEHYLEFTIEEEEAGKAERVREQLALKVKRTKPRWSHQSLTFA